MKIEMTAEVVNKSGKSKNGGKDYSINSQVGYITLPDNKYPRRIEVQLADNAAPYPVGEYSISEKSFVVGRFDRLELGRLVLVPATKAVGGKAA